MPVDAPLDTAGPDTFGLDAGAPSGPPPDLDAAIAARFRADEVLPALATGGIFNGQAGERAAMPYVVFSEVTTKVIGNPLGRRERRTIRFSCYAKTARLANVIGEAVVAAYHLRPLEFADGYLMAARWTGGSTLPGTHRGAGSDRVWNRTLLFQVDVGRQVP